MKCRRKNHPGVMHKYWLIHLIILHDLPYVCACIYVNIRQLTASLKPFFPLMILLISFLSGTVSTHERKLYLWTNKLDVKEIKERNKIASIHTLLLENWFVREKEKKKIEFFIRKKFFHVSNFLPCIFFCARLIADVI